MSRHRGGVCYLILQDEHIQWLVERLHVDPNITIESLLCQLNEVFQLCCHVFITCISKAVQSQVGCSLKLLRYEPNDYNNEERLREHIEWCWKFLELSGNMVGVIHVNEVRFNLYLTGRFERAHWWQRCQQICPTQRDWNLSIFGGVVGREGVIAYDVTLGAYNTYQFLKLIQTKVVPSLDRQRFILMDNVPFHKSRENQQAVEDVGHIYFRLPSHSPFLNATKAMYDGLISKIIKHY